MMIVGATTFAADQEEPLLVEAAGDESESGAAAAVSLVGIEASADHTVLDIVALNVGRDREVRVGVDGKVGTPPPSPDVSGATTRTHPSLVPSSGLSECTQRLKVKDEESVNDGGS